LTVESDAPGEGELARIGPPGSADSPEQGRRSVEVPGSPRWTLTIASQSSSCPAPESLASALGAWRAGRRELERVESGLEARTRELVLLQEFGRGSAEARTPDALLAGAAALLQRGAGVDAVVAAFAFDPEPRIQAYLARRLAEQDVDRMAAEAGRLLGWSPDSAPGPVTRPLDTLDETPGRPAGIPEEDLVVLPVFRRGAPIASVAVLMAGQDEAALRLVFGAANQISLHLDRILTMREAEQDRFRAVLNSMPQAVLLTDPSLRILLSNPAASRLLEKLGERPGAPLARVGDLRLHEMAGRVGKTGNAMEDSEARLEDGTILHVTLSSVEDDGEQPGGLVLVMADVTESRRLQDQLAQSEKLSSLGQMISGVAHELNNPLASVVGFAQMVRASTGDDKLARRLEMIGTEADRCQRIVKNLLSFARRHEPERKSLSLNEVVSSVLGLVGYQLRISNIEVKADLDRDLPPMLGDPHQLQQALLNLITNAQHELAAREGAGTIRVRTRSVRGDRIVLEVEDDGPGIESHLVSKIFDPFFTTKADGEGTGLGLSLVYGIITAHGGEIHVQSRVGHGTSFRIGFPARREAGSSRAETVPSKEAPTSQMGRILVVDDEPAVARLLTEVLVDEGHEVERVHDRREALRAIESRRFDLVVLDHKMPGMNVVRFRSEIRARRPGLEDRVVIVTGDTVSREPEELARKLDIPVVHKPFDLDELRAAVRSRLGACPSNHSCRAQGDCEAKRRSEEEVDA
jgi:nitrogen-specific signal transduction histidine kinase/CheY-like chemotaxis protein